MSEEKKQPQAQAQKPKKDAQPHQAPQAPVISDNCKFEECKHKHKKFGFCMEHYEMYMAGVIRGDGHKPSDYAEKLARFHKANRRVA
jgi:hypothetical protein